MVPEITFFDRPLLAIETSCDETSAAILEGRAVKANVVASQIELHPPWGGVVPEAAARAHVEAILPVIEEALGIWGGSQRDIGGIAVTNLSAGNGKWQYSLNAGSSWTDVGTVSASSALLLRSADLLRFVPDGKNATAGSITYKAWDQTGATAGQQGTYASTATSGSSTRR